MSEQANHGGIPWREAFAQAWHTVRGHRMRSLLTLGGVVTAMFLFVTVQAMQMVEVALPCPP